MIKIDGALIQDGSRLLGRWHEHYKLNTCPWFEKCWKVSQLQALDTTVTFLTVKPFHPHLHSTLILSTFTWTFNVQTKASPPVKPHWNCTPACLVAWRMPLVMGTYGTETWSRSQRCWSAPLQQWLWAHVGRGHWGHLQVWPLYHIRDNKRLRRELLSFHCFCLFDWERSACALKATIILESLFSKS